MLQSLWTGYWEDWKLHHLAIFDGINKTIRIGQNTTYIDVKTDLYSDWKEWSLLRDNTKYSPAFRVIGGDPVGGGLYAGDLYFLINGWKIILDHNINFNGVIYSDDYPSPFETEPGIFLSTNIVSNLVIRTEAAGGGSGLTSQQATQLSQTYINTSHATSSLSTILNNTSVATSSLTTLIANDTTQTIKLNQIYGTTNITTGSLSTIQSDIDSINNEIISIQNSGSLTPSQITMLTEMYELLGLDPSKPLIVSSTSRVAGGVTQTISQLGSVVTVTRI